MKTDFLSLKDVVLHLPM